MSITDWKAAAIDWFKTGKATDEQWDELAEVLCAAGEDGKTSEEFDRCIFNHACYMGATPEQFGDSL